MSDSALSMGELLAAYAVQLVVFLPVALLTLWLLRHRWQVHLAPDALPTTMAWKQALLGAGTALAALAITLLPGLLAGGYSAGLGWQPYEYSVIVDQYASAAGITLLFLIQSLFEEALFRGIGLVLFAMLLMWIAEVLWLQPQQRRFGKSRQADALPEPSAVTDWRQRAWLYSGLIATVVLSVGFGFMHAGNPGVSPLALLNIVLAGLWLGLLFWKRVSLLAAWLAHFAWNATLALLGLPISGWAMLPAPLGFGIAGAQPGLLTGGAFGPEASLPCTVAFAALTTWLAWRILRAPAQPVRTAAATSAGDSGTGAQEVG